MHEDDWLEEAYEDRMSQSYTSDPDNQDEDDQPFFGEDVNCEHGNDPAKCWRLECIEARNE